MSKEEDLATGGSFCDIVGCSGTGTTTRWVMTEKDGQREIHVCWKHAEGDISETDLEPVTPA